MTTLDTNGETSDLDEAEVAELHELSENLHSLSGVHTCMCWQKSRLIWLKEGDAITKFFHAVMSSKMRCNAIQSIQVNDVQIDGVQSIREAVFSHFSSNFMQFQTEGGQFAFSNNNSGGVDRFNSAIYGGGGKTSDMGL